jgi:hypothetical protein
MPMYGGVPGHLRLTAGSELSDTRTYGVSSLAPLGPDELVPVKSPMSSTSSSCWRRQREPIELNGVAAIALDAHDLDL